MRNDINSFRSKSTWIFNSNNKKINDSAKSGLSYDYALEEIAMKRAAEIAVYYNGHERPDGSYVKNLGYGENLSAVYGKSISTLRNYFFETWKEDSAKSYDGYDSNGNYIGDGHRRNMRDARYKSIGIAIAKYNNGYYAVQIFSFNPPKKTTSSLTSGTYKGKQSFYIRPGYVTNVVAGSDLKNQKDFNIDITNTSKTLPRYTEVRIKTNHTFSKDQYAPVKLNVNAKVKNTSVLRIENGKVITLNAGSTAIDFTDPIKNKVLKTIKGTVKNVKSTSSKESTINGITYVSTNGYLKKKQGWSYANGKYSYYNEGKKVTGFYYFTSRDGEKTPHWSYFDKNGILLTGWQQLGKGTNNPDGDTTKHFSYFGSDGWLRTGWQIMGKGTENSFDEDTAKHFSYFGSNGWLRTGWQIMGKGTDNSFGENTAKHFSYFGSNGWLRTGWQSMGKGTNNSFGENTTKHFSYFGDKGWLVTGKQTINKKTYTFNDKGWLINPKQP